MRRAGRLNRRIEIQRRGVDTDPFGQPVDDWSRVGHVMADVANETGLGAIRTSAGQSLTASVARYSFMVRFAEARALGVDAGMRVLYDGDVFDVKGVTRDFKDRSVAFIICEQGGNDG